MNKFLYNILLLLIYLLNSTGSKKVEYYTLVSLQVMESDSNALNNSSNSKNDEIIKDSYNINYTNSIINDLEIKNITFTEEDVNLTDINLTEKIELLNNTENANDNLQISLKSDQNLGNIIDNIIILGNNKTVENTFDTSPLVVEDESKNDVLLDENMLYRYRKTGEQFCQDKPFYTIKKSNIPFYNDDCHKLVYYCEESEEVLSTDITGIFIDNKEIKRACEIIDGKNVGIAKRQDDCSAVFASFSALLAVLSVIVPAEPITGAVLGSAALAGGSAGFSSASCLLMKLIDTKNEDYCCIKESVSSTCLGICTPANYVFTPRRCEPLLEIS